MPITRLTAQLNGKLQPMHRGEFFERPLGEALQELGIGDVSGGGTLQRPDGEIACCDIEIELTAAGSETISKVVELLEGLGAPKGSVLINHGEEQRRTPFGEAEGAGIYLNGTELPDAVYADCDSNFVYSEFAPARG